jgi:hypothetical protein
MTQEMTITKSNSSVGTLIRRVPLVSFFGLACAFTWLFLIADALGSRGLIPFRLATQGPGIAITVWRLWSNVCCTDCGGVIGGKAGLTSSRRL